MILSDNISDRRLLDLLRLIAAGREHDFYTWTEWRQRRAEVLHMDHYECQHCRAAGRYRKAEIVHHVKHLKDRPDLALSIWDGGERQLVSLCKSCHETEHPESLRQWDPAPQVTAERWD